MHPKLALATTHQRIQSILNTRKRIDDTQQAVRDAARKEILPLITTQTRNIDDLIAYETDTDKQALRQAREDLIHARTCFENNIQAWQAWKDIEAAQELTARLINEPIKEKKNQSIFRKLRVGVGAAALALAALGNTTKASAAPPTATAHTANVLVGTASYYGTQKDMFGWVETKDPLVRKLITNNKIDVSKLPDKVIAVTVLTKDQMKALYKIDRNKYRLLTARGNPYDPRAPVVAMSPEYKGKRVEITNLDNGKKVVALVDDTGDFHKTSWVAWRNSVNEKKIGARILDAASIGVAQKLGYTAQGTARVQVRVLT